MKTFLRFDDMYFNSPSIWNCCFQKKDRINQLTITKVKVTPQNF